MDYNGKLISICCIYALILSIIVTSNGKEAKPTQYYFTRDCKNIGSNDVLGNAGNRRKLKIAIDSVVIYSHDENAEEYPDNFHCELIASAQPGMQIVLQIEYLNIPSHKTKTCDSYLYVFDSNTSSYMAMPEAGGERGLCHNEFPKMPIFSSKSYITLVFKSGAKFGKDNGFKLTLTAIHTVEKGNQCTDGEFFCSNKYFRSSTSSNYRSGAGNAAGVRLKAYCISNDFLCDSVRNCPGGSDEKEEYAKCSQNTGILNQFLSLGLFASIGIVVGCVVLVTIFITVVVRCCRSTSPKMTAGNMTPGSAVPLQLNGSSRVLANSQPLLVGGVPSDVQQAHERASSSGGVPSGKSPHLSNMRQEYLVTKIPPSQHFPQSNGGVHPSPNVFRKGTSPHFSRASNGSHDFAPLMHQGPFHPSSGLHNRSAHSGSDGVFLYDASSNNLSYPGSSVDAMQPYNPNTSLPSQDAYYIPAVNGSGQPVFSAYPQMMTSTEVAHRSHTPTSSRSGKSARSRGSRASGAAYHYYGNATNYPASVSSGGGTHQPAIQGRQVKYHHRPSTSSCDTEKITYPVQL